MIKELNALFLAECQCLNPLQARQLRPGLSAPAIFACSKECPSSHDLTIQMSNLELALYRLALETPETVNTFSLPGQQGLISR